MPGAAGAVRPRETTQKFGTFDPRVLQVDPFRAPSVGALPRAVASIQAKQMIDVRQLDPGVLSAREAMGLYRTTASVAMVFE